MPRPTRAYGRPGTKVLPADWAASHRPTVEGTLHGTVTLRRPGSTQTWSDALGEMVETPRAPYATVACRVQRLGGDRAHTVTVAGDREVVADYLVVIPAATAGVAHLDLATVSATGDALFDGRTLTVGEVVHGTERFERDLFCVLAD